jgi:hypothetical protein
VALDDATDLRPVSLQCLDRCDLVIGHEPRI